MQKKSPERDLTELEGRLLALVWRYQPTTAYQIRQTFAQSPVREMALSQGSVYPAIGRLKKRGLVLAAPVNDGRQSEHLTCTRSGVGAIRAWLRKFPVQLPDDPLRGRLLAISVLKRFERAEWVKSAKEAILRDLADVEEFAQSHPGPLFEMAHDNARSTLLARIRWLERVETKIESLD